MYLQNIVMPKNITNTSKDKSNIVTWVNKDNGKLVVMTKAEYQALAEKDNDTAYLIVE